MLHIIIVKLKSFKRNAFCSSEPEVCFAGDSSKGWISNLTRINHVKNTFLKYLIFLKNCLRVSLQSMFIKAKNIFSIFGFKHLKLEAGLSGGLRYGSSLRWSSKLKLKDGSFGGFPP